MHNTTKKFPHTLCMKFWLWHMYLYACVAVTHKKYWISLINHAYSNFNNTKRNPRQNSIVPPPKQQVSLCESILLAVPTLLHWHYQHFQ